MSTSPTFVLVPGHWHPDAHLTPLIDALASRGYHSRPLQLHSVGAKSTRPTFSDDVCVIYSAVVKELIQGNDVCLVVHSYAGMPGAEAINRIISDGALDPLPGRGRLVHAIFIAAYTFPPNFVMDVRAMLGPENPAFDIDNDNILHITSPWHNLFNDLPLSAAKPYVDTLAPTYYLGPSFTFASTPLSATQLSPSRNPFARPMTPTAALGSGTSNAHTPRAMSPAPGALSRPSTPTTTRQKNDAAGPVISSDKWRKARVTAVLTAKDNLIPMERQETIWTGVEQEWMQAGHACFVSRPEVVAGILCKIVEREADVDIVRMGRG